ncbi:MAG: helix-turn-helix domain-containing protein [Gemmataceae bacterium]
MRFEIDGEEIKPLVREVVQYVLAELQEKEAVLPENRLAFTEPEAASMLGLARHQLRDERHRGRIEASVGPGKRILYSRNDLLKYLASRRWSPQS